MRENNMSVSTSGLRKYYLRMSRFELPSWLALILIAGLGLLLSGCITPRQQYGLDRNAPQNIQIAGAKADPIITGALPANSQSGWTPRFYAGTGVKPGQNEVQSAPFTPKGIESAKGLPPKPNVAHVDLPAPPLPLPESTAAPSTTLFGRAPIGRQVGFASRGSNFGGTALGWQPKFHQTPLNNGLKVFPQTAPAPSPGFRVANNASRNGGINSQWNIQPKALPFPGAGQSPRAYGVVPPVPVAQPSVPPNNIAPPPRALVSPPPAPVQSRIQVFNRPVAPPPVVQHPRPTLVMNKKLGAYPNAPVPKGANLVVTGNGYLVDTGDELNIRVLGQNDLTGQYKVDSSGAITMPMISTVHVRGKTVSQISSLIQSRLRQGFLRTPSVAVEVNSARPFYILGQVKNPGKYNFVNGLTVSQAVAIAGGYQPRAKKGMVRVTRQTRQGPITAVVPNEEPLMPGDTIYVKQRWF